MPLTVEVSFSLCLGMAGFLIEKFRFFSHGVGLLEKWFFRYILPAFLFLQVATLTINIKTVLVQAGIYYVLIVLFFLLCAFYLKRFSLRVNVSAMAVSTTFGNLVFFGLPVFDILGGHSAIQIIYLVMPLHSVVIFFLASIFNRVQNGCQGRWWRLLKFPVFTYALVLGMVTSLLTGGSVSYFHDLKPDISLFSKGVIFFILGVVLARNFLIPPTWKYILILSALKMVILPVFVFIFLAVFDVNLAKQLMLVASLPIGFNAIGYAARLRMRVYVMPQPLSLLRL